MCTGITGPIATVGSGTASATAGRRGPVPFLAEAVLGVELAAPGGTDIRLRPQLGDLDWAEGSYPLPAGDLHVRHRRNADGSVQTSFEAPAGVRVTVEG